MLSTLLLVLFGIVAGQEATPATFVVEPGRAGQIEIGMPADAVVALWGRQRVRLVDLSLEGSVTPALELRDVDGAVQIVAEIREWPCQALAVWRIRILDSRFRTSDGLAVGAPLRATNGESPTFAWNEGYRTAVFRSRGMSFELTNGSVISAIILTKDPAVIKRELCP
jgi:hypothetical protein